MAVNNQIITDKYAIYNGDSCEVLRSMPSESIHMALYSPPFATENGGCLYNYSSSVRDLSNARTYDEFFEHYEYIVTEIARILLPGRIAAVHCMDVPIAGANIGGYSDFPGDIIRLHRKHGFDYLPRIAIWKEPLEVRNRTMLKALTHRQTVEDCVQVNVAAGDYLIPFRKKGTNPAPVTHENGFLRYAGSREMPADIRHLKGFRGKQTENRYSHWIWRQYASCVWNDIRMSRVVPYHESRGEDDERHQHPLQLDVIERCCEMWTNPGEKVLTPFMGVGSEVCGAVALGRMGVGVELKPEYYMQAVKNCAAASSIVIEEETEGLFDAETLEATVA